MRTFCLLFAVLPVAAQTLPLVQNPWQSAESFRRQVADDPQCGPCKIALGTALAFTILGSTGFDPDTGMDFHPVPETATAAREELARLNDPRVLLAAGRVLSAWSHHLEEKTSIPDTERQLSSYGLGLLERAMKMVPDIYGPQPGLVLSSPWSDTAPTITVDSKAQETLLAKPPPTNFAAFATQACAAGPVRLEIGINTEGKVARARYLSGHSLVLLDAIDAVSQSLYRPTLRDGRPVQVRTEVSLVFPEWKAR